MTEAEEIVAFVQEAIATEGRPITFVKLNKVAPDPTKPHKFPADPMTGATMQDGFACFVPLSSLSELGIKATKRDLLKTCDAVAIVSPITGVDFATFDKIIDGTDVYTLSVVDKLQPGGTAFVWYIGAAK